MRTRFDIEILNSYDERRLSIGKECRTRLNKGLFIALNRQILDRDGWFMVESQQRPGPDYRVTENDCTCRDSRAPVIEGRKTCKHRLAVDLVLTARCLTQVWDEEVVNTEPNPLPEDLHHISVFHSPHTGPEASIVRNWRRTLHGQLTKASLQRLGGLALDAMAGQHWQCRPYTMPWVGYVLERTNYA